MILLKARVKIIIGSLLCTLMLFTGIQVTCYADEVTQSIKVNITVSDITDYTNPLNVLVPRTELEVSEFDISKYGDTLKNVKVTEGITYMHALVQLHRNLYGEDLSDKLLLDENGVTRYIMGRQAANVMYRNGDDIFALPQDVPIQDGDEIQICLYNESYSQGIATFSSANIDAAVGEATNISLYEHFDSPRSRQPLQDCQIVNQNGLYYTDADGNVITSNADGSFDMTFSEPGTYIISAMPEVNYYMEPSKGETKTIYEKKTTVTPVQKEIKTVVGKKPTEMTVEEAKKWMSLFGDNPPDFMAKVDFMCLFQWDDHVQEGVDTSGISVTWAVNKETKEPYNITGYDAIYETTYEIEYKTETSIVEKEVPASDELLPAISYTLPFAIVNVTTDFKADEPSVWFSTGSVDTITSNLHNSAYLHDDAVAILAAFNDSGTLLGLESKKIKGLDKVTFTRGSGAASYKLMYWDSLGSMLPIHKSYTGTKN